MKTVRCYRKYGELKKEIASGHYDLSMDSIGQLINYPLGYSTDITIRDYDGNMCIDYDVYKIDAHGKALEYLDGGKVCDASQMPFTDKGFWRLIERNIKKSFKSSLKSEFPYEEREAIFMPNALINRGNNGHMSIHDMDCEWLRRQAYLRCIENADMKKVDKIVDGIKAGKINKVNLFDEVRKMTKKVTSDHSIKRWLILTEWFNENEWF